MLSVNRKRQYYMSSEFDTFLREAFPETTDLAVLRVISQGIALADDVRRNTIWLSNLIGSDIRGNLRRAAAMYSFKQACISGELPFDAEEVSNTTGSSHLLEIKSGSFDAHIVRTESPKAFPKDAPIRQDKCLKNEADLFDDGYLQPFDVIIAEVKRNYSWLSFNADLIGNLAHVGWAMPSSEGKSMLGFVKVLRTDAQKEEFSDFSKHSPPAPDPLSKVRFTQEIERTMNETEEKTDLNKGS